MTQNLLNTLFVALHVDILRVRLRFKKIFKFPQFFTHYLSKYILLKTKEVRCYISDPLALQMRSE
jgi:hypothetical protein